MAVEWCKGCGDLFGSDTDGALYCSPECREMLHRRLAPPTGIPVPSKGTSVYGAFEELANESSKWNSFHKKMMRP